MKSYIFVLLFVAFSCFTFADNSDDSGNDSIGKLELSGSDSFSYDINNKIRKAKSSFSVGIGGNMVFDSASNTHKFNASVIAGYSYFFHKSFGLRAYLLFDNTFRNFYLSGGFDAMMDFFQIEQFGIGLIIGSSAGYNKYYSGESGFLSRFHAGASMIFDSGKSRLEFLARFPYVDYQYGNRQIRFLDVTYILMYSYSF